MRYKPSIYKRISSVLASIWNSIKKAAKTADEKGIPLVAPKLGEKYLFDKPDMPRWWE